MILKLEAWQIKIVMDCMRFVKGRLEHANIDGKIVDEIIDNIASQQPDIVAPP